MISVSLILLIGVLLLLAPTAYAGLIGAPYAPTHIRVVNKAFDQIDLGEDDTLIDLGAGDGKILLEAASRGANAIGFELSPVMFIIAWLRLRLLPLTKGESRAKRGEGVVRFANFYKQDLSKATVVFAFLLPKNMPRLKEFLEKQTIPSGKYLLVYSFPFRDVAPLAVVREDKCGPLYVYDLKRLTRP